MESSIQSVLKNNSSLTQFWPKSLYVSHAMSYLYLVQPTIQCMFLAIFTKKKFLFIDSFL